MPWRSNAASFARALVRIRRAEDSFGGACATTIRFDILILDFLKRDQSPGFRWPPITFLAQQLFGPRGLDLT